MAINWTMVAWALVAWAVVPAAMAADGEVGMFGRCDRNRDGFVDASEAPPALGRRMGQFDKNADGKLDPKEFAPVCGPTLKFTFPTVVDEVDNKVSEAYAGWPSRFVVVGQDGRIAFDGGPGPQGFQPAELEKWLAAEVR